MDIKQYISSGVLEQYVLGNLSPAQEKEVEEYAATYPEVRRELDEIERSLEQYAQLHGKTPPAGVLDDILEKVESRGTGNSTTTSGEPATRTLSWKIAAIIITGLFGLAAYLAYTGYQENQRLEANLDRQRSQLESVQAGCDSLSNEIARMEQEMEFLRNPGTRPVIMRGTDLSPQSVATVYVNENQQTAYLNVVDLPQPPSGKQYQLWAIVDGNPVDMGVFDLDIQNDTFTSVPFIEQAQAFAVTLEDEGGNPSPTLDQMYVIGNA